jgi:hypothetical protein
MGIYRIRKKQAKPKLSIDNQQMLKLLFKHRGNYASVGREVGCSREWIRVKANRISEAEIAKFNRLKNAVGN